MATPEWRTEIEKWALGYAERLNKGVGRAGVAIGGSIARGQHWEHSDLEIAILVDHHNPAVTHFSLDGGRGVEIFQLERKQLEDDLANIDNGNLAPAASWPVQLYRSQVIHDPSNLLHRFATDRHLFSHTVRALKLDTHQSAFADALREANTLL